MKLSKLPQLMKRPGLLWIRVRDTFRPRFFANSRLRFWMNRGYLKFRFGMLFKRKREPYASIKVNQPHRYITIVPNKGAGIGHQFGNWNAALFFSRHFRLTLAHQPLAPMWESFLGLGQGEIRYDELAGLKNLKRVKLPPIRNEKEEEGMYVFDRIINFTFPADKVLFELAFDQNLYDHTSTSHIIKDKYRKARAREPIDVGFERNKLNIAVHIRRGDVVSMRDMRNGNWRERWLGNDYFVRILKKILETLHPNDFQIQVYSQGEINDFREFGELPCVTLHLNEDERKSFHGMVVAHILLLSPSGFSYLPGMISNGVKIARYPWWHHIPDRNGWIRSSEEGSFDSGALIKIFQARENHMPAEFSSLQSS